MKITLFSTAPLPSTPPGNNFTKGSIDMKTAYRIVTPIIAVGGIAIGIFLKLFTFVVGNSNDTINNLISAVSQLSSGKISTTYEYSLFELIKMAVTSTPKTGEDAKTFTEVAKPILPDIYAQRKGAMFCSSFAVPVLRFPSPAFLFQTMLFQKSRTATSTSPTLFPFFRTTLSSPLQRQF